MTFFTERDRQTVPQGQRETQRDTVEIETSTETRGGRETETVQTDREILYRQTETPTETDSETERDNILYRKRETPTETQRETVETETERDTHRETERETM